MKYEWGKQENKSAQQRNDTTVHDILTVKHHIKGYNTRGTHKTRGRQSSNKSNINYNKGIVKQHDRTIEKRKFDGI